MDTVAVRERDTTDRNSKRESKRGSRRLVVQEHEGTTRRELDEGEEEEEEVKSDETMGSSDKRRSARRSKSSSIRELTELGRLEEEENREKRQSRRKSHRSSSLRSLKKSMQARREEAKRKWGNIKSGFLESQRFISMVNQAFDECDIDESGTIDASELYAGVLLLYHHINKIPWGGRKPPPERDLVIKTMRKYDLDDNESLDREEFLALCQDLCSNIVIDVSKRVVLVLFVFPMLALPVKHVLEFLLYSLGLTTLLAVIVNIPEQIFTSAVVALMITVLPYVEAQYLQPSHTWEAVASSEKKELKEFKKQRRKKLESSKVRRYFNDKENNKKKD